MSQSVHGDPLVNIFIFIVVIIVVVVVIVEPPLRAKIGPCGIVTIECNNK